MLRKTEIEGWGQRMSRSDNQQRVMNLFSREQAVVFAKQFVDDPEAVAGEALQIFERMVPEMAYVDDPDHIMASAVFGCCGVLALYLPLRDRGVEVHQFGGAFLEQTRTVMPEASDAMNNAMSPRDRISRLVESGKASKSAAKPGEFVFDAFWGDRSEFDWGMNVESCAICHAFSKYGATELVPYMCATDDLMSDFGEDGLRRTGTIALGSHRCDFRYKSGGEPLRLVEQYPDQIRDLDRK